MEVAMGDWGVGLLESDSALDVVEWWDEYDPKNGLDHISIENRFFKVWGDGVRHGDHHVDCQILALASLEVQNGLVPSKNLKAAVEYAAGRELSNEMLSTWPNSSDERRKVILELLRKIGAKPKRPRGAKKFQDPLLEYSDFDSAKAALLKIVDQSQGVGWTNYFLYQLMALNEPQPEPPAPMPRFLWSLERMFRSGVAEKALPIYEQARMERAMSAAVFLGISLRMSREEIESLLELCRKFEV
jgi:hypothetical protein